MPARLLLLLLSPVIGSFIGVLICRLPTGRPVVLACSRCEGCDHVLTPGELVPLVSFMVLAGRCRWCGAQIAPKHLAVEFTCLGIAAWAVLAVPDPLLSWLTFALGSGLLALAWIDWQHMVLPDVLTLPLVLAGLGVTVLVDPASSTEHALGAIVGYLGFRAVEVTYRFLRGRDGLGQGDAKLLAAAGAWLGLSALPRVVFIAAIFALVLVGGMQMVGRTVQGDTHVPFGPALCAAIWSVWIGLDAELLPMLWEW